MFQLLVLVLAFADPAPIPVKPTTITDPGGIPMTGVAQVVTAAAGAIMIVLAPIITALLAMARLRDKQRDREHKEREAERDRQAEKDRRENAIRLRQVKVHQIRAARIVARRVNSVRKDLQTKAQSDDDRLQKLTSLSGDGLKIATEALRLGNGIESRHLHDKMELAAKVAELQPDNLVAQHAAMLAAEAYRKHQVEQATLGMPPGTPGTTSNIITSVDSDSNKVTSGEPSIAPQAQT